MIVMYLTGDDAGRAGEWSRRLGLRCVGPRGRPDADVALTFENGVPSLRDNRVRRSKPLVVDFEAPGSTSRKQLLGRAVGRRTRTVIDATAGWGEDARRLCRMGYQVTAMERSPVMAALLADAAERARRAGRLAVPDVVEGDAILYLNDHPRCCDCVFIDPMFPPKRRSSTLARRPLRLLRELTGDDPDKDELFAAAGVAAVKRVVVKRPDRGEPVFPRPTEVVTGKLVRYDVYHLT